MNKVSGSDAAQGGSVKFGSYDPFGLHKGKLSSLTERAGLENDSHTRHDNTHECIYDQDGSVEYADVDRYATDDYEVVDRYVDIYGGTEYELGEDSAGYDGEDEYDAPDESRRPYNYGHAGNDWNIFWWNECSIRTVEKPSSEKIKHTAWKGEIGVSGGCYAIATSVLKIQDLGCWPNEWNGYSVEDNEFNEVVGMDFRPYQVAILSVPSWDGDMAFLVFLSAIFLAIVRISTRWCCKHNGYNKMSIGTSASQNYLVKRQMLND